MSRVRDKQCSQAELKIQHFEDKLSRLHCHYLLLVSFGKGQVGRQAPWTSFLLQMIFSNICFTFS